MSFCQHNDTLASKSPQLKGVCKELKQIKHTEWERCESQVKATRLSVIGRVLEGGTRGRGGFNAGSLHGGGEKVLEDEKSAIWYLHHSRQ